jgi:hypothetical protein
MADSRFRDVSRAGPYSVSNGQIYPGRILLHPDQKKRRPRGTEAARPKGNMACGNGPCSIGSQVTLGTEAPWEILVSREEIKDRLTAWTTSNK